MKMSNISKYPQTGINKTINVQGLSILLAPFPLEKSKTSPARKSQGPSAPHPALIDKSSDFEGLCPGSTPGITCTGPSMCPASSPVSRVPDFRKNPPEIDDMNTFFATSTPNSSQTAIFEKQGNLNELNTAFYPTNTPELLRHKTKKRAELTKEGNIINTNATENILGNKKDRSQCRSAPVRSKARSQGASAVVKTLQ